MEALQRVHGGGELHCFTTCMDVSLLLIVNLCWRMVVVTKCSHCGSRFVQRGWSLICLWWLHEAWCYDLVEECRQGTWRKLWWYELSHFGWLGGRNCWTHGLFWLAKFWVLGLCNVATFGWPVL